MKITFIEKIPLDEDKSSKLFQDNRFYISGFIPSDRKQILEMNSDHDAIISRFTKIDKELIDSFRNLKYVILASTNYNWVDLQYAKSKGITVINCPKFNSISVSEFCFASLLSLTRKIQSASNSIKQGFWNYGGYEGVVLNGKNAVIIGRGNIGTQLFKICGGFGMKTKIIHTKTPKGDILSLLENADYLFVAIRLHEKTYHYLDKEKLSRINKNCIIVNVSQGEIIDQSYLIKMLRSKQIRGACLDCFEDEPFNEPTEEIKELCKLDNVLLTPHMAWNTKESRSDFTDELLDVIITCINGNPINVLN